MRFIYYVLLSALIALSVQNENVTIVRRSNVFLSRKKRYVQWPKGSNFVINLTCTKPLLRYQPLTWNTVYEMDVPFAVVTDNSLFFGKKGANKAKRHVLERRNLYEHLEDFMTVMGLNGKACVNRLLCEAGQFVQEKQHSMIKDLVQVLFRSFLTEADLNEYDSQCEPDSFALCPFSLLGIFLNSSPKENNLDTLLGLSREIVGSY